jgi:hypothetical protein
MLVELIQRFVLGLTWSSSTRKTAKISFVMAEELSTLH